MASERGTAPLAHLVVWLDVLSSGSGEQGRLVEPETVRPIVLSGDTLIQEQ